jgi:hypothetical protein
MSSFGDVGELLAETWFTAYHYPVGNWIRIAVMKLPKDVPPNIVVTEQRTLVSYEGQPATCYGCGETAHVYQDCPDGGGFGRDR